MDLFAEGATFESIVRYVASNTRITHSRVGYLVMEVLKAGMSVGKIKKTPRGNYVLISERPWPSAPTIREPRFSDDDSNDSNDDIVSTDSL
ncbi:uncharacterized protein LOC143148412 [Ptiloglossa arizonensis]|uniref:uncharacterized protein LOC143148412 n=1 Tax=Ptiloglossa arizonensis TaxID=3350558 RepID=UPI003F9F37D0